MTTARQTFEQIAQEHEAMIKRIAASYEARPHLAEELVQEIYFAIWRAIPTFRGDASIRTFVARIATNRAVTHVARAVKSTPPVELKEELEAPGESPETQVITADQECKLVSAIRGLPLAYRQPAMLTLEGFTPKEIADSLGITTNAVAIRMSRAKELLRSLVGGKS